MWGRIAKRLGRTAIAVAAAGITMYATNSPYALVLAPVLTALGKWMRERGIEPVPL